jgi:rubrerythrin
VTSTAPTTDQNAWLNAPPYAEPPAPTARLVRALEAHEAAEAHDVATCRALQQHVPDAAFGLLLGLIVEGEQRHQALLKTMAHRLATDDAAESTSSAPPTADLTTITSLRALIRDQHEGARYLRHLARQEPSLYDGLFATLFEVMARDSEKHASILRYLLRRVEEPAA